MKRRENLKNVANIYFPPSKYKTIYHGIIKSHVCLGVPEKIFSLFTLKKILRPISNSSREESFADDRKRIRRSRLRTVPRDFFLPQRKYFRDNDRVRTLWEIFFSLVLWGAVFFFRLEWGGNLNKREKDLGKERHNHPSEIHQEELERLHHSKSLKLEPIEPQRETVGYIGRQYAFVWGIVRVIPV